jgi:hypothetical protein
LPGNKVAAVDHFLDDNGVAGAIMLMNGQSFSLLIYFQLVLSVKQGLEVFIL